MICKFQRKLYSALLATSLVGFVSCSSGDSDEEAVEPSGSEEKTGEEKAADTAAEPPAPAEGATAEGAAPPAPQEAAPAAAPVQNTGAMVRYVSAKTAVLRDQPSDKGKKIGSLTRGDHVLVSIEGEWARTDDGKFTEAKNLSEKPLGKKKKSAVWK